MTPDAALRMAIYQEGQRAYRHNTPCPYTGWRANTWKKGHDDAATYYQQRVQDTARQDAAEAAVPEEAHDALRAHVDRLNAALDEARAAASVAYLAFEQVTAERDKLRAVLKDVGLFLHHCWCDVQMNDHSFGRLNDMMTAVDEAIKVQT